MRLIIIYILLLTHTIIIIIIDIVIVVVVVVVVIGTGKRVHNILSQVDKLATTTCNFGDPVSLKSPTRTYLCRMVDMLFTSE